jgi:hypothetical protein
MGETDSADKFMVFGRGSTSPICSYWNKWEEGYELSKLVNPELLSKKLMVKNVSQL